MLSGSSKKEYANEMQALAEAPDAAPAAEALREEADPAHARSDRRQPTQVRLCSCHNEYGDPMLPGQA